ncbi:hypothetical protein GS458_3324 [Geobacillus stearothermophilus]|nr:hypothetical protein GS458_3324 [Geobacillus stearothermophilus]
MTFAFFYRASLGGPDERREQKFATLVGDHFGMSPTNILLTHRANDIAMGNVHFSTNRWKPKCVYPFIQFRSME